MVLSMCQLSMPYSFNFKPVPLTELMCNSRQTDTHTHTVALKRERILYTFLLELLCKLVLPEKASSDKNDSSPPQNIFCTTPALHSRARL